MGLAICGLAQGDHLDRGLLATGAQGSHQRPHLFLVLLQPVAHQMGLIDGAKRDLLDHQPLGTGSLQHRCQLLQRALCGGLGGDLRNRRR